MAILDPHRIPADRGHLPEDEADELARFHQSLAEDRLHEAHDLAEGLWMTATDAHRTLYQGLANSVAAMVAADLGHRRGAREIARRSHQLLAPFPRRALSLDLDGLLAVMDAAVDGGDD